MATVSCKRKLKADISINPAWHKMSLPGHWEIYAPSGFETKTGQGVDSYGGYIYSKSDSIILEYDIAELFGPGKDCDLETTFRKLKADIDTGFYKNFYNVPITNLAYIDTIDNKLAVIVTPKKSGKGTFALSMSDCPSGASIGISERKIPPTKRKLVLEIFKTIKLEEN